MNYIILDTHQLIYSYIIVSLSSLNIYDSIIEIELELKDKKFQGRVLLDHLSVQGNNKFRFIDALFDGNHFLDFSRLERKEVAVELETLGYLTYLKKK